MFACYLLRSELHQLALISNQYVWRRVGGDRKLADAFPPLNVTY